MQFATESWNGRAIVLGGADQSARGRGVYAVPWGQPATLRLRPFLAVCNGSRGGRLRRRLEHIAGGASLKLR